MPVKSNFEKAAKIALPSFAVGAGIYWFLNCYLGPLTPKAEHRMTDISLLVQCLVATAGWIHALWQNKNLRAELKELKERTEPTSNPS